MTSPVEFDFGDGSGWTAGTEADPGRWVAEHTYTDTGVHTITARHSDSGLEGDTTFEVVADPAITKVTPGGAKSGEATTFTVTGNRLAEFDSFSLVEQGVAAIPVTPVGLTDDQFTFDWTPAAGQTGLYDLVGDLAGTNVTLVYAVFIGDPAVPTISWVEPNVLDPDGDVTLPTIHGWLLDPVDCLAYNLTGQGGGGNLSGMNFADDGLTLAYPMNLGPGVWDFHGKVGGAMGSVLCTRIRAMTVRDRRIDSITPNPSVANAATSYTATGVGFKTVGKVRFFTGATQVAEVDITSELAASNTEITFDATLPAGTYDVVLRDYSNYSDVVRLDAGLTVT